MLKTRADQVSLWEAVLPDEVRRLSVELQLTADLGCPLRRRCGDADKPLQGIPGIRIASDDGPAGHGHPRWVSTGSLHHGHSPHPTGHAITCWSSPAGAGSCWPLRVCQRRCGRDDTSPRWIGPTTFGPAEPRRRRSGSRELAQEPEHRRLPRLSGPASLRVVGKALTDRPRTLDPTRIFTSRPVGFVDRLTSNAP
jgi:hypothetical protein